MGRFTCVTTDGHKTTSHNINVPRCSASDTVETIQDSVYIIGFCVPVIRYD